MDTGAIPRRSPLRCIARPARVALLIAAFACGADPLLADRLSELVAFGSRAEGSAGEKAAFSYVEASLRAMGLSPSVSGFSDAQAEDYSRSRIVEAELRGQRQDELAIIVPVNSWADASDPSEGAYAIALALDEAERVAASLKAGKSLPVSLRFVFLGAEKRGGAAGGKLAALGSSTWMARQEGRANLAVVYLNLPERAERVDIDGSGSGILAPYWYYQAARLALEGSGVGYNIAVNRMQPYRLGLATDFGPAAPYLEAGIPALELRAESAAKSGEDSARRAAVQAEAASLPGSDSAWLGSFLDALGRGLSGGFPDSWDRHYFIFQLGAAVAVIREQLYVAFLVCVVALAVASFLAATVARRRVLKKLVRRLPSIGAAILSLFGALVLVFLAGKGVILLESLLLGSSEAWMLSPRLFALARVAVSFFLFLAILSLLIERKVLSPNPYFYEFAALICLAVDVFVFSAVDLSTSFYFMWALLLVELSLALRRRWLTLCAYLLMYAPILAVAFELAVHPDLGAYARLVTPDLGGLLALSALSFPFFAFTASPLLFFSRRGPAARKRAALAFAVAALAVEASALGGSLVLAPLAGPGRRDLSVSELVDQDSGRFELELKGMRRLGSGRISRDAQSLGYASLSDRAMLSGPEGGRFIEISSSSSPFLDRADERVSILFSRPPYSVDLALSSDEEMLLYDCSLPYKLAVDGTSASVFSGVNPGSRLEFSLAVPASFKARLVVVAHYLSSGESYSSSSGAVLRDEGRRVKASAAIGHGEAR